ncbi:hypothetical protein PTSG_03480 [Salpingoeca rosetta]|uniref:Class I SAM-dependent methyltransferase n=1 Tax=Salpingoeca rosetta (strain ATCC 50818 / BSB-021) TaxID=946362 RepID=F2U5Q7_SALR5|nr:uncharacterized protein PTSG_03480 [Salpingoeca rosetta]EGD82848.1 hypothetical protein PTSG_03480 [Salpingoeca rosetta]|eukprot:XP_004995212.1 hypothetical protein PTSG_03480 [Salpingoeca rosetta]
MSSNPSEYERLHEEVMRAAPEGVWLFASREADEETRRQAIAWMRNAEDPLSPMALQVKYAFSIPTTRALQALAREPSVRQWISCGSGTGYWELLMQRDFGLTVRCFDKNTAYPEPMRHVHVDTAGPEYISEHACDGDGLFLAWPDDSEACTFGLDCLRAFSGNVVAHVGELRGETLSANPWGQSTSAACQQHLTQHFRLSQRVELPRWPYQRDSLTIWHRASQPIDCAGADFVSLLH